MLAHLCRKNCGCNQQNPTQQQQESNKSKATGKQTIHLITRIALNLERLVSYHPKTRVWVVILRSPAAAGRRRIP